ncbi:hypothetical protein RJ639_001857 [Escallonia herrerae]|uniref:DUF4283 domain-containing protein n=1 Tax=Escallonia herrerae TaxID=1293975 RepID=A0AA88X929_9ASTE|nr:hypothetical protein RJ639_001857 [Escallonia herrerae]
MAQVRKGAIMPQSKQLKNPTVRVPFSDEQSTSQKPILLQSGNCTRNFPDSAMDVDDIKQASREMQMQKSFFVKESEEAKQSNENLIISMGALKGRIPFYAQSESSSVNKMYGLSCWPGFQQLEERGMQTPPGMKPLQTCKRAQRVQNVEAIGKSNNDSSKQCLLLQLKNGDRSIQSSDSEKEKHDQVPIWVSYPGLKLQLWNPSFLSKIKSVLGTPMFTDHVTAITKRHADT